MKQQELFKKTSRAYGGELMKRRKGRLHGRPLDTKNTMHLVLRSSKARGVWSFRAGGNQRKIEAITSRFALKFGVLILQLANVGNHLHFQLRLTNRGGYRPFIRALTSAIMMAVTGASRWNPLGIKFWDYRPFTRVVVGLRGFLKLRDYVKINQWEGFGLSRAEANWRVKMENRPKPA